MEAQKSSVSVVGGRGRLPNPVIMEEVQSPAAAQAIGKGEEALKDVLCGSTAGVVGKYIEYPFDTIKVRLQSQPDQVPLRYTGPLDCFKKSLQHDGFTGIYRGISAPLVGAAVETSTLFFSVSETCVQKVNHTDMPCSIVSLAMHSSLQDSIQS
jgi:ornithine carrier protein